MPLGYIRLFSFDLDDARHFVKAFTNLITKEGFPQEGLILDVRGNPGGNIRAAESLLQLFTPNTIEPELFEFINTPLNFQICKSAPDDWDLKRWLPSIGDSVLTGGASDLSRASDPAMPRDCRGTSADGLAAPRQGGAAGCTRRSRSCRGR